jgi:hypothetical protein
MDLPGPLPSGAPHQTDVTRKLAHWARYPRPLTGRGDPERIYRAQRAGIFRRLVDAERVNELDAEHWISPWEREAEGAGRKRGSLGFWDAAWRWIAENRRKH